MIWIFPAIVVALAVVCFCYARIDDDFIGGGVFLSIISLFFVGLLLWIMVANGSGLMKWQAFYQANTQNYQVAVDETASYLSEEEFVDVLVGGSLEKFKLAGFVSERIVEWRDAVNEYNSTIASMQYFNRNIFTGTLVPDGVEDMRLIIIQ